MVIVYLQDWMHSIASDNQQINSYIWSVLMQQLQVVEKQILSDMALV